MQGMYDDAYAATRIIRSDVGRGGEPVRDGEQVRRGGGPGRDAKHPGANSVKGIGARVNECAIGPRGLLMRAKPLLHCDIYSAGVHDEDEVEQVSHELGVLNFVAGHDVALAGAFDDIDELVG